MKRAMIIIAALAVVVLLVVMLRGDGEPVVDTAADTTPALDTTPADLSKIATDIPEAAPNTFTPRQPPRSERGPATTIPNAPEALMAAVEREQSFSRFCYQEFGLKADPTLRGGVAMVVTVSTRGITGVRVGADNWTSRAGKAVNQCLSEKARQAWEIMPGSVRPGQYAVQLRFSGA